MKKTPVPEFLHDRKLQLAIERCVEIIGEASRRISDEFKSAHAEIPSQTEKPKTQPMGFWIAIGAAQNQTNKNK